MKQFVVLLACMAVFAAPLRGAATAVGAAPAKRSAASALDSAAASKASSFADTEGVQGQLWNETRVESPEPEPESSPESEAEESPEASAEDEETGDSPSAAFSAEEEPAAEDDTANATDGEPSERDSSNADEDDGEAEDLDDTSAATAGSDDEQDAARQEGDDAQEQEADGADEGDALQPLDGDAARDIKESELEELFKNAVVVGEDGDADSELPLNATGRTTLSDTEAMRKRRRLRSFWVWVVIAAKHKAWVFKNAKHLGDVHNWNQVRTYKFRATRRDAVAIKSLGRGAFRGVVAVIRVDWPGRGRRVHRRYYVTGRTNNYKAIETRRASARDRRFWMRPAYKTCHWRPAGIVPTGRHWARRFPFRRFRARYVWARGERRGRPILMRYKLAGERCRRPPRLPARCNCRPVPSQPNAACYQFTNKRMYKTINRRGRCRRRRCAPKYQCVFGRRRPLCLQAVDDGCLFLDLLLDLLIDAHQTFAARRRHRRFKNCDWHKKRVHDLRRKICVFAIEP